MAASRTQTMLNAAVTAIKTAIGTGSGATHEMTTANITAAKLPWNDDAFSTPALYVTPVPEAERDATNASDDVGYGFQVSIFQSANRDKTTNADRLYYWRETVAGLFRNKRISAVSGNWRCTIEPKPVIDEAAFANFYDATAFVVRVWVRVQRP